MAAIPSVPSYGAMPGGTTHYPPFGLGSGGSHPTPRPAPDTVHPTPCIPHRASRAQSTSTGGRLYVAAPMSTSTCLSRASDLDVRAAATFSLRPVSFAISLYGRSL